MKNVLESFAILLVGLLSLGIVYFIVQYNMIDEKNIVSVVDDSMVNPKPVQLGLDNDDFLDDDFLDEDSDLD